MTAAEAVRTAQEFVIEHGLIVGPIINIVLYGGEWLIVFEYAGPPVEKPTDYVVCPSPDAPTGVLVDDATGEASLMGWM